LDESKRLTPQSGATGRIGRAALTALLLWCLSSGLGMNMWQWNESMEIEHNE
jgi:hypothetical protein